MKKILSFVLALVFWMSSTGISVYQHYCGDFLAATSFFHKSNPCMEHDDTKSCEMKKEMDCCEDEFQFIQLDSEFHKTQTHEFNFQALANVQIVSSILEVKQEEQEVSLMLYKGPPQVPKVPLYKQLHRLTFYG